MLKKVFIKQSDVFQFDERFPQAASRQMDRSYGSDQIDKENDPRKSVLKIGLQSPEFSLCEVLDKQWEL